MEDPVTLWIDQLRNADEAAARQVWDHFASRLHELARRKLQPKTRRTYDEEDAAQSAFHSLCAGFAAGRFPELLDRDGLWRLMLVITSRKVARRHRHDLRDRRDVRRNLSDSIFDPAASSLDEGGVGLLVSREPTPEFAAECFETFESLLQTIDEPELRQVAVLRMEGYSDSEIAARLECSRRTVQRRLEVIRRRWNSLEPTGG